MALLRIIFIFLASSLLLCSTHVAKAQSSFTFNQTLYDKKWNDESEIVFGQSTALTGQTRELGYPLMVGIQAAFKEINELGGVWGGKKLRLYSLDDGYEPPRCINNTLVLLNNQTIFGLLGYMGTGTSQAILNLLIESKMPYIGALTGGLFLRTPFYPNIINVRASYQDETAAMVEYLVNIKMLRRIAIFYQNDAFGVSGLDGSTLALTALGMSLVSQGTYERNTIEVSNALESIVKGKPQAIICMSTYKPTVEFINRVMARTDYDPAILFVTGSFIGSNILPYRDRVVITQVFPAPTNTKYPIVLSYQRAMKAYDPTFIPSLVELEGYMAAKLTINILTQRVSGDLTRSNFIDLLYSSGTYVMDNTVVGPYTKCSTTSSSRRSTFVFEDTSSSNNPILTEITPPNHESSAHRRYKSDQITSHRLRSDWTSRRVLSTSSSACSCNQGLRSVWKTIQNADASFTEIGDPVVWDLPGSSSFSCFFDPTKISLPIVFGHISDGSAYDSDFISGVSAVFKDRNDKQSGVRGKRLEILPIVINGTAVSVESLANASRKFVVDNNAIGLVGSKINSIPTATSFLEQFASQFSSMVFINPETSFDTPQLRDTFSRNIIHLTTSIRERLLSVLDYSMNTLGLSRFSFISTGDTDGKYIRSEFMRMLEEYELYLDSEIMFSSSNILSSSQVKEYLTVDNANAQAFVISIPKDDIDFRVLQEILTGIASIKLRKEVVVFCLYFRNLQWEPRIADLLNNSSFSSISFYLVEPFPYVRTKHSFIDTFQSVVNKYLTTPTKNTTGVVQGFLVGSFIIEILDNISPQSSISGSSFMDTVFSDSEFIKYQIPFGQFSTTKKCSLGMRTNYIVKFATTQFVPVTTMTFDKSKCGVDMNALKASAQAPIIFGRLYPLTDTNGQNSSQQLDDFSAGALSLIQAMNDYHELPRTIHLKTEYYTSEIDMIQKATDLIERTKIFGFLGSKIIGNASGLSTLIDARGTPLIGPVSGHTSLRSPFSRFIINLRPSIVEEVVAVARYAHTLFFQVSDQLSLTILVANQEYWTSVSRSVEDFFEKSAENVKITTVLMPSNTKRTIKTDTVDYGNFVFVLANEYDTCSFVARAGASLIGIPSEISCPTLSGLRTNVVTASFLEAFYSTSFTNIMAKEFIQYFSLYYPQRNKTMLSYEGFAVCTMVSNILKYMKSVNLDVTKQSFVSTLFYRSTFELGVNNFGPYGDTCDTNSGTTSGTSFTRSISSTSSSTCSSTAAFCSCNQGAKEIYLNFLQDSFVMKKIQNYSLRFQTCGIEYIIPGISAGGIAGIVIGGTLFFVITLIICIVAVVIAKRDPTAKHAPKSGKITCAFTDVQNSTKLWQSNEKAMRTALEIHNTIMRSTLMQFRGYEVKTNGDSFYVVFKDPLDAVTWAMEVQLALLNAKWPSDLYHEWDCRQEWDPKTRKAFWSGLRVRIGLHYGKGDCVWDKTMKRFDYFGNVVNKSARIEALAHGGQILVSEELFYKTRELYSSVEFMSETSDGKMYLSVDGARHHPLSETHDTPSSGSFTSSSKTTNSFKSKRQRVAIERTFTARDLGVYPLKGLSESSRVFEIKCPEIESRTYPPLRVAVEDLDRSESSVQREYQDFKKRLDSARRSNATGSEASPYEQTNFDAIDVDQGQQQLTERSPEEHP